MHKNTLLLVIFLALISLFVAYTNLYKQPTPLLPEESQPIPTPTTTLSYTLFTNSLCGISFSYPDSLHMMESSTSSAIFVDQNNPQNSILFTCQSEIPRVPLPEDKMETRIIQNSSVSATLYHDASQNDGTPIDKFIFTHPTKHIDVFIAGLGDVFNAIIDSVRLL